MELQGCPGCVCAALVQCHGHSGAMEREVNDNSLQRECGKKLGTGVQQCSFHMISGDQVSRPAEVMQLARRDRVSGVSFDATT